MKEANIYQVRKRKLINDAKRKPCADCGVEYPPCVMDLDHRDPTTKLFSVGAGINVGMDKLLAEIDKCDVVCANCHRLRTWKHSRTSEMTKEALSDFEVRRITEGNEGEDVPIPQRVRDLML